jgi:hypothetical protein
MACREVGTTNFSVLAMGLRDDVLFDVGQVADATHEANGVAWYFDENWSWGFAAAGATVNRSQCDSLEPTDTGRLCWRTTGDQVNNGSRCGTETNLNDNADWERMIFQSNF